MTAELESPGPVGPQGPQGVAGPQGAQGVAGPQGNPGPGVPAGGNVGDEIIKTGVADYQTGWAARLALGVASALALSSVAAPGVAVAAAHEDHVHPAVAVAASPASVALIAQAAASATANVQEWRDSAATLQAGVTAAGSVMVATIRSVQASKATLQPNGDTGGWLLQTQADANKGLAIRRNSATQTAALLEVQDQAGTAFIQITGPGPRLYMSTSSYGLHYGDSNGLAGRVVVYNDTATGIARITRGAAAQAAELDQWQDSTGAVLSSVLSNGSVALGAGVSLRSTTSGKAVLQTNHDTGSISVLTNADANKGLVIRRNSATQSANLFEVQDELGAVLSRIRSDGAVYAQVYGGQSASATLYVGDTADTGVVFFRRQGLFSSPSATAVPVIARGIAAQTNDLFQGQDSTGLILANVASGGQVGAPYFRSTTAGKALLASNYDTGGFAVLTNADANKGLVIRRNSATQSANLFEVQDQAGTPLTYVRNDFRVIANSVQNTPGGAWLFVSGDPSNKIGNSGPTSAKILVVFAPPSQIGDPLQVQDSTGNPLARVDSAGVVYGTTLRTITGHVILQNENSGGVMWLDKSTAQAATPAGAGSMKVYVRDGTNAGTLKLVAIGPGGVQVTIVDNVA